MNTRKCTNCIDYRMNIENEYGDNLLKRFRKHIFICTHEKVADHPVGCCSRKGSNLLVQEFKKLLVKNDLTNEVRANKSGCLGACKHGAAVVVYPEQTWYGGVTVDDVAEIVSEDIMKNNVVNRLKIEDPEYNHD